MFFVSDIDIRVGIMYGPIVDMKAGVPVELPKALHARAKTLGCKESAGKPETNTTEEQKVGTHAIALKVIKHIIERGDPSNFDARNKPKLSVINSLAGVQISKTVRDSVWRDIQSESE